MNVNKSIRPNINCCFCNLDSVFSTLFTAYTLLTLLSEYCQHYFLNYRLCGYLLLCIWLKTDCFSISYFWQIHTQGQQNGLDTKGGMRKSRTCNYDVTGRTDQPDVQKTAAAAEGTLKSQSWRKGSTVTLIPSTACLRKTGQARTNETVVESEQAQLCDNSGSLIINSRMICS